MQSQYAEVIERVEKFEWVRRNTEQEEDKRKKRMDEEDA